MDCLYSYKEVDEMKDSLKTYDGQFDCTNTNYINLPNNYQIICPIDRHITGFNTDSTGKKYATSLDVTCKINPKPTSAPIPTQPSNSQIKISPYLIGGIIFIVVVSILLVFINKNIK